MRKPDRIEILETNTKAEIPYRLIKEVFVNRRVDNQGKIQVTETSRLVNKTIREEGDTGKAKTRKEMDLEKKKRAEEEAVHTKKLIDDEVKKEKSKKKEVDLNPPEEPRKTDERIPPRG